jgi:outer membrane protein assembly factor BamB
MIASAAEHSGILAVSVSNEPSGARTGLFGNAQVMALSKDGEVLWEMKTTEALPRLFVSAGRLIVLEAGKVLCVQPDTGDVFFWAKVDGYPITCAKDVILVYKDDGFALVDPGISSP